MHHHLLTQGAGTQSSFQIKHSDPIVSAHFLPCFVLSQVTVTTHTGSQDVVLTPINPKQLSSKDFPGTFQMENVACKDVSLRGLGYTGQEKSLNNALSSRSSIEAGHAFLIDGTA